MALYVTAHRDLLRSASLLRQLPAVAAAHRGGGYPSSGHELVRRAIAARRRRRGTRPAE